MTLRRATAASRCTSSSPEKAATSPRISADDEDLMGKAYSAGLRLANIQAMTMLSA